MNKLQEIINALTFMLTPNDKILNNETIISLKYKLIFTTAINAIQQK
ncbi:hypothetical protein M997_2735 [Proteus hauseri ATCC 700826]|uniref:Uncharacterized protein n=1 Tax=Proteus hauseri ATCC 700826 TaxID=1354271 RepID=A0AAJ3HQP1_PROHU|nr:hypothetical protein M997_2735 [Proteus hauseri ATCC 700826]